MMTHSHCRFSCNRSTNWFNRWKQHGKWFCVCVCARGKIGHSLHFHVLTFSLSFICMGRHMWRIFFWRNHGGIPDCGCRKIWAKSTESWTWIGCITFGGRIASSKMRRKLHFTRCPFRITISGCTTIKPFCTCPSKFLNFLKMRIFSK